MSCPATLHRKNLIVMLTKGWQREITFNWHTTAHNNFSNPQKITLILKDTGSMMHKKLIS